MRDKRDRQKKRFIAALTVHGTVYHAAQAAGISRQTVYAGNGKILSLLMREEAHENAVDAVESTIYQQAIGGNTLARYLLPQGAPSYLSLQAEHRYQSSEE